MVEHDEAKKIFEKDFRQQRKKIQDYMHLHFGIASHLPHFKYKSSLVINFNN